MPINLEHLADNTSADRNFRKLAQLAIDTGGQSIGIRFGTGVWTWPGGSNFSGETTVTHGLGRTPVFVVAFASGQPYGAPPPTQEIRGHAHSYTDKQFKSFAKYDPFTPGAGATQPFVWAVIG